MSSDISPPARSHSFADPSSSPERPRAYADRPDGLIGLPLKPHEVVERSVAVPHEVAAGKLGDSRQLGGLLDLHVAHRRKVLAHGGVEHVFQLGDALTESATPVDLRQSATSITLLRIAAFLTPAEWRSIGRQ